MKWLERSGIEVGSVNNPDGTKTVAYHGDDIHDFAWTASPHYLIYNDTFQRQHGSGEAADHDAAGALGAGGAACANCEADDGTLRSLVRTVSL